MEINIKLLLTLKMHNIIKTEGLGFEFQHSTFFKYKNGQCTFYSTIKVSTVLVPTNPELFWKNQNMYSYVSKTLNTKVHDNVPQVKGII